MDEKTLQMPWDIIKEKDNPFQHQIWFFKPAFMIMAFSLISAPLTDKTSCAAFSAHFHLFKK
jgi:hypothetical protein